MSNKNSTPRLSNESVKAATGKTWEQWTAILDAAGARDWPHAQIAKWLRSEGHVPQSWYNQMVTIGYEQAIGRRVVGQSCNGDLRASASKTVVCDMDEAFAKWQVAINAIDDLNGTAIIDEPRISQTDKWRYWRANLEDGTLVNVNISAKDATKCTIGIEHAKLETQESAAEWKAFWKGVLAEV